MNQRASEPSLPSEPVYYRIGRDLVEIDADGLVPREVHLASDGRPKRACGPDEPTNWGDEIGSEIEQMRPGTPEFDHAWAGLGARITREEFEAAFEEGKEHPLRFIQYPRRDQAQEIGGCLLIGLIGLVVLAIALGAMAFLLRLLLAGGAPLFGPTN